MFSLSQLSIRKKNYQSALLGERMNYLSILCVENNTKLLSSKLARQVGKKGTQSCAKQLIHLKKVIFLGFGISVEF